MGSKFYSLIFLKNIILDSLIPRFYRLLTISDIIVDNPQNMLHRLVSIDMSAPYTYVTINLPVQDYFNQP